MKKPVEETLIAAFPEFDVLVEPRPDGSLLLTLQQEERLVMRRALSLGQVQSEMHLEWLISSIQRDLAIEAGRAPMIAKLQSQSRIRLPTYEFT